MIPGWAPRCVAVTAALVLAASLLLTGWLVRANCFTGPASVRRVGRSVWPVEPPAGFEPVLAAEMFATRVAVFRSGDALFVAASASHVSGRPARELLELIERACGRSGPASTHVTGLKPPEGHVRGGRQGPGTQEASTPKGDARTQQRALPIEERLTGSSTRIQISQWQNSSGREYVSAAVLISEADRAEVLLALLAPKGHWEQAMSRLFDQFVLQLQSRRSGT